MKYEIDYKTAYQAHAGTSFFPEKRAKSEQEEFQAHVKNISEYFQSLVKIEEQKKIAQDLTELYIKKYHKLYTDYLHSRSGLMSTMITGPANFPVRRMEKKNQSVDNKLNALLDFTKSKKAKYAKIISDVKPEGWNELEELKDKLANMEKFHEGMKKANSLLKKLSKQGGVSISIFKELFEIESGLTIPFMVEMHWRNAPVQNGYESFELTNHNSRMKTVRAKINQLERIENATEQDNKESAFPGGTIVQNKIEDRLQILFDDIPAAELRTELKSNGFRWSPKNKAWQRQLTRNALFALKSLSFMGGE